MCCLRKAIPASSTPRSMAGVPRAHVAQVPVGAASPGYVTPTAHVALLLELRRLAQKPHLAGSLPGAFKGL